jgi:hypothetical protein
MTGSGVAAGVVTTTGFEARMFWNAPSVCVSHRHDGGKFQGPMATVGSTDTGSGTEGGRNVVGKSRLDASSFVRLFDNNLKSGNLSAGRPNPGSRAVSLTSKDLLSYWR